MEGLLYLRKYGISGPEFGIKEELVTERGRQLFQVLLTGGDWNHTLISHFTREGKLLHPMTALGPMNY